MTSPSTTDATLDTRIPGRWLAVFRAIWLLLVLVLIIIIIASISPRFNELRAVCDEGECNAAVLSAQEADALREFGLSMDLYAGYHIGLTIYKMGIFIPLAGLIFWRRSDTWMGILVSLTLVLFAVFTTPNPYMLMDIYPSLRPPIGILNYLTGLLLLLLFYLFPDGRFVPRWTRGLIFLAAGAIILDSFLPKRNPTGEISVEVSVLLLGFLIGGVFAQIYRYRRVSTPIQRQQTKWALFGLIAITIVILTFSLLVVIFPLQAGPARLAYNFSGGIENILFTIFPVAIVISILRYRLWDIDIIINRVLVYGLLTAVLAGIYFGSVVLLQTLLAKVTGQSSAPAIVVSTLFIAALFAPLRRRIQSLIDRRFFRRKYDAAQILATFSASVRNEVDLDELTAELLRAVQGTMQPAAVSLWLRAEQNRLERDRPEFA